MPKTSRKLVMIGCGAVGSSVLYSCMNQGIADEYVLIDAFPEIAQGNVLDLHDSLPVLPHPYYSIKAGSYEDCADADIIVISAGKPQASANQDRLALLTTNAKIIYDIGENVKKSGFKGITVIISNPCDVLTTIYQRATGFDAHRVFSSGTLLDSSRLQRLLGSKLNVHPQDVKAFMIGEHGDSGVFVQSHTYINNLPLSYYIDEGKITNDDLVQIKNDTVKMAYKIISLKRATFYGVGATVTALVANILNNSHKTLPAGIYLDGQYDCSGAYVSLVTTITDQGWTAPVDWNLSKTELAEFQRSFKIIKNSADEVIAELKKQGYKI